MPLDQQGLELDIQIRELPDLPSALIRLALSDLEKVEEAEEYQVNMRDWHIYWDPKDVDTTPDVSGKCVVCLAGGVMAFSMGADRKEDLTPSNFPLKDRVKLSALDDFRTGDVGNGFSRMGLDHCPLSDTSKTHYSEDPARFKTEMHKMADDLEAAGF